MSGFNPVLPSLKKKKMKWVPKTFSKEQKEKKSEIKLPPQSQHERCLFCKQAASKNSPEDLLLEAVFNDQADKISSLIQMGADPNVCRGMMGDTALHFAVMRNKKKAVVALIEGKANINLQAVPLSKMSRCFWRGTPLHSAASIGNKEVIEILLGAKAKVDSQDAIGETPLHNAIHQPVNGSHEEIIQTLLNAGADPTVNNRTGLTPIALAYGNGETGIGNLLTNWQKSKRGSGVSSQLFSPHTVPSAQTSKPPSSASAIISRVSGDRKSVSIGHQRGSFSSSFSSPWFGAAHLSPFLSKPPAPMAQSKNGEKNKKKREKQQEKQRNQALSFS